MALVLVLSSERGGVFLDEGSVLAALGLVGLRVVEPRGLCWLRLRDTGLIMCVLLLIDIVESGGLALLLAGHDLPCRASVGPRPSKFSGFSHAGLAWL